MKSWTKMIALLLTVMLLAGSSQDAEPSEASSVAEPRLASPATDESSGESAQVAVPPAAETVMPEPARPALRDPTQPSEQMKALLGQGRLAPVAGVAAKLPSLRIKGRVASAEGDVLVLLQVGQQLERVSADTEWTTEDGLTITVVSVSRTELRLQVQPLNRIVTIR